MPTYTFKCPKCKRNKEVVRPMSECDSLVFCYQCEVECNRDFQSDLFHTASDTYAKPIISDSLAVGIDQIAEHRKQFPDIQMTNQGQPIFDKYSTHEAYLEKTNFVKHPGKIRRKGKKIATVLPSPSN